MAGDMEGRDWDRQSQIARAKDHISQYNNGVSQSNWDNDVKRRALKYGAMHDYSKFKTGQASETSNAVMASGNAAGQSLSAYGQYRSGQDQAEADKKKKEGK